MPTILDAPLYLNNTTPAMFANWVVDRYRGTSFTVPLGDARLVVGFTWPGVFVDQPKIDLSFYGTVMRVQAHEVHGTVDRVVSHPSPVVALKIRAVRADRTQVVVQSAYRELDGWLATMHDAIGEVWNEARPTLIRDSDTTTTKRQGRPRYFKNKVHFIELVYPIIQQRGAGVQVADVLSDLTKVLPVYHDASNSRIPQIDNSTFYRARKRFGWDDFPTLVNDALHGAQR